MINFLIKITKKNRENIKNIQMSMEFLVKSSALCLAFWNCQYLYPWVEKYTVLAAKNAGIWDGIYNGFTY